MLEQGISDPRNYTMSIRLPSVLGHFHAPLARSVVSFPKSILAEKQVDTLEITALLGALTFLTPAKFKQDPQSGAWQAQYRFFQANRDRHVTITAAMTGEVHSYSVDGR